MATLDGMRIAILVTDNFEQVEMTEPRAALEAAGATTLLVSDRRGMVQGMHHDRKAGQYQVEATFDEVNAHEFDAVLVPGGVWHSDRIRVLPAAQGFVRSMDGAGKPIGFICHAAWLLVSAGLAQGRRLTSWPTLQDDIRNAGGEWVNKETVLDGNWLSSRKPDDLPAFNVHMIELLARHRRGLRIAAGAAARALHT